jgi:hypothetical protein
MPSRSVLSVQRHEGLQNSPYIEYTCQVLERSAEHDSDLVLVSLVRMQCIVESAYKSLPVKIAGDETKAPVWMHVEAARVELQKQWDSLRPEIQKNRTLSSLLVVQLLMKNTISTHTNELTRLKHISLWD